MEIFCLQDPNGRLLDPSVQATVLAKYSRSPLSAREVLSGLTAEEANKFHSKWTITYGHSSVAELACVPICFEGISMIASKFVEKFQRAGYSEKSTRYQRFSKDSFVNPTNLSSVNNFASAFYEAYDRLYERVLKYSADLCNESDVNLPRVKARAFDSLRYLLPAGTGTNLAAVLNLRDLRYMISEALGHENPEIQQIGKRLLDVGHQIAPALLGNIKPIYNPFRNYFLGTPHPATSGVVHLSPDSDMDNKFRLEVTKLYGTSYEMFSHQMSKRGANHLPDIFRLFDVKLDVLMDYGAYRDLQRHRRCEQFPERLCTGYGYEIPEDIKDTDLEPEFRSIMERVLNFSEDNVANDPDLFQYLIPMGYRHRTIFKMDIAELYYIVELRTKPQGHISYRRIAYQMFSEVSKTAPEIMQWCNAVKPLKVEDHL